MADMKSGMQYVQAALHGSKTAGGNKPLQMADAYSRDPGRSDGTFKAAYGSSMPPSDDAAHAFRVPSKASSHMTSEGSPSYMREYYDDGDAIEHNADGSVRLFPCSKCGKTYKQRNSLYKHEWEHSEYWEPTARKFNMSKHQQVQAMQAAMQLLNFAYAGEFDWTKDLPEVRFLDMK